MSLRCGHISMNWEQCGQPATAVYLHDIPFCRRSGAVPNITARCEAHAHDAGTFLGGRRLSNEEAALVEVHLL